MAINAGSVIGYLDLDTSRFTSALGRAREQMSSFADSSNDAGTRLSGLGGAMKSVGGFMSTYVTLPLIAAGTATAKYAMDTEQSMSKVNSILQLSDKEFKGYEQTIKKGANEIGLSYSSYADAAYDAISSGVKQGEVTNFLTDANKLAKAGLTDLTSATNILTTVQNAYGDNLKNITGEQMNLKDVSNVLIQTQNLGKVTVDELASSMGKIIPTANACNVSVDQLGAGYAIMTSKGIASAEATTYMNSMFNELSKSGSKTDIILREMSGKSFAQLSAEGKTTGDILEMLSGHAEKSGLSLSDLFGSAEAGKAALTLLSDGAGGFNTTLEAMTGDSEACDKAFKQLNGTAKEQLSQSLATLTNALADIGQAMLPVVASIASVIAKFAEWASNLAQTNPVLMQVIVIVGGIVAAIGPLLLIIGSVISIMGGAITTLMTLTGATTVWGAVTAAATAPVTLIIAAIGALIAIGVLLVANWDTVSAKCTEVWNYMSNLISTVWTSIQATTSEIWTSISSFLLGIWNGIVSFINPIIQGISNTISTVWNYVSGITSSIWNSILGILTSVWGLIKALIDLNLTLIKTIITSAWNVISSITSSVWNVIKGIIQSVWSAIKPIVTSGANAVKSVVTSVFNAVSSFVSTVWNGIKSIISSVWSVIKSVVSAGANAVKSVCSSVFGSIENILTAPFKAAQRVISGILGGITGAINKVSGALKSVTKGSKSIPSPNNIMTMSEVPQLYNEVQYLITTDRQASFNSFRNVASELNRTAKSNARIGEQEIKTSNTTSINLNIEKFVNERKQDVKELVEEIAFEVRRKNINLGGTR